MEEVQRLLVAEIYFESQMALTEEELRVQRELAKDFRNPPTDQDPAGLVHMARRLAPILLNLAGDQELWSAIESTGVIRAETSTHLYVMGEYNWTPVLSAAGYRPPPPAEQLAKSLMQAAVAAKQHPTRDHLNLVRDRLTRLADGLALDAEQASAHRSDPNWWDRFSAHTGLAFHAVRRLGWSKVLFTAAGVIAGAGITIATGGIAAEAMIAAGSGAVTSLIGDIGQGYEALRDENIQAGRKARAVATDRCLADLQDLLKLGRIGDIRAELDHVRDLARIAPTAHQLEAQVRESIERLHRWSIAAGGVLVELWELVAPGGSRQLANSIEELAGRLADFEEALPKVRSDFATGSVMEVDGSLMDPVAAAYSDLRHNLQASALPEQPHPG